MAEKGWHGQRESKGPTHRLVHLGAHRLSRVHALQAPAGTPSLCGRPYGEYALPLAKPLLGVPQGPSRFIAHPNLRTSKGVYACAHPAYASRSRRRSALSDDATHGHGGAPPGADAYTRPRHTGR